MRTGTPFLLLLYFSNLLRHFVPFAFRRFTFPIGRQSGFRTAITHSFSSSSRWSIMNEKPTKKCFAAFIALEYVSENVHHIRVSALNILSSKRMMLKIYMCTVDAQRQWKLEGEREKQHAKWNEDITNATLFSLHCTSSFSSFQYLFRSIWHLSLLSSYANDT